MTLVTGILIVSAISVISGWLVGSALRWSDEPDKYEIDRAGERLTGPRPSSCYVLVDVDGALATNLRNPG